MARPLGDSLSSYPNLEFLKSGTLEGLKEQLDQIRLPFKILTIYFDGNNHVAWVSLTQRIKKINKKEI